MGYPTFDFYFLGINIRLKVYIPQKYKWQVGYSKPVYLPRAFRASQNTNHESLSTCKQNSTRVLVRHIHVACLSTLKLGLSISFNDLVFDKFLVRFFGYPVFKFFSLNTSKWVYYKAIIDCLESCDKSVCLSYIYVVKNVAHSSTVGGKKENLKHFIHEKKEKKLPKTGRSFFPRSKTNSTTNDVDDDFSYSRLRSERFT